MDPWTTVCQIENSDNKITESNLSPTITSEFEDNFTTAPEPLSKLPDSAQYLACLEEKLQKLKTASDFLQQLTEKREACLRELLNGNLDQQDPFVELEDQIKDALISKAAVAAATNNQ